MTTTKNDSKTIHLEATIPASPERIYELLINGAKFGNVTGKPGKGAGSEGAYLSLFDGWIQGRQIELIPNKSVIQAWRFKDWDPGIFSIVRFTLIPEGNNTKLVVDQHLHPVAAHEQVLANWQPFYFDPFIKHFAVQ
ncbi:MAG: SRPBCC domain-containing protein [Bacteroidia bacterium]